MENNNNYNNNKNRGNEKLKKLHLYFGNQAYNYLVNLDSMTSIIDEIPDLIEATVFL